MVRSDLTAPAVSAAPSLPALRREVSGVMGCRGSVTVVGALEPQEQDALVAFAERRLRVLEGRWSRFVPDSEISVLASSAGRPVVVSEATRLLVRALVDAAEATDGVFDPTRLPDLIDAGYATSVLDPARTTTLPADVVSGFDLSLVEIDDDASTVRLPPGGSLDPGGLGKGLAADLVVAALLDRGAEGAMVEIGGDLRVAGRSPYAPGWLIDVEDPLDDDTTPRALAALALADGGVATTSRLRRRWTGPGGSEAHHVLDPRTGRPTTAPVVAATVVTATGSWSEAFAKLPLVLGEAESVRVLEQEAIAALLVLADGTTVTTSRWHDVVVR